MQSNYIPAPIFTGILSENKQLEKTSLSEETGTERCGKESRLCTKLLNTLSPGITVCKFSVRALRFV